MAQNQANYSGSVGSHFLLVLESHEIQVDTANNRSLIEVTLYMTCTANSGHVFDNFGDASWSLSGTESGSGNYTYDFNPGVGQNVYLMNNAQYWVNHASDGTGSVSLSASSNAANSPFLTTVSTSVSYSLTNIQRTAGITSLTLTNTSDVGFTINASADSLCSQMQYSLDNGSTYTTVSGNATSWTIPITNKPSGTTFSVKIIITNAASSLTTTSGAVSTTTLAQNNFF